MVSRLIVDLPDDLKKRLKSYCANNGTTIHDEILAMICRDLESCEEATKEKNPEPPTLGQQEIPIKIDSSQQIKRTETEEMVRKTFGLGLRPKEKVLPDFNPDDPFAILGF